ncbi:Uncharacterised protein [Mycobacteroides abscessus subsp. abscessus]|nr:Uncharacterised protein [Mycobacteroides abscessus subsp. abscessus]
MRHLHPGELRHRLDHRFSNGLAALEGAVGRFDVGGVLGEQVGVFGPVALGAYLVDHPKVVIEHVLQFVARPLSHGGDSNTEIGTGSLLSRVFARN